MNDHHYRVTLLRCKEHLLNNYCILPQIDCLVSHMLQNNIITSSDYQNINEMEHAFDKLNNFLMIILHQSYEHIQSAFEQLINKFKQDGRTDLCQELQKTLDEQKLTEPSAADNTTNDWQYRESFIRCNQHLLDNYSIPSQIDNLAMSMFEKYLITYKDHQYISETRSTRNKLKYLINTITDENYDHVQHAFTHIMDVFDNDDRKDLCEQLQKTLESVKNSPQPAHYRETVPDLISRLEENFMSITPIEVTQSLKKIKNYVIAKEFTVKSQEPKNQEAHVPSTSPKTPSTPLKDSIDESYTDLMVAVMNGDIDKVQNILDNNVQSVNQVNSAKQTALILATRNASSAVVGVLIKCDKVDANIKDPEGRNAMMHCAARGDADMMAVLLDSNKTDLTAFDIAGLTFEFYLFGEELTKELKVDSHYFVNLTNRKNKLDWSQRKTLLECLLSRKTVNKVNLLKATLMYGNETMVSLLLQADIKDILVTDDMKDFIQNIITTLNPVLVNMLDELMIDVNMLDKKIVEDIIISVMRFKCPDTCAALLEHIHSIHVEDTALETALYILSVRPRSLPYILKKESLDLNAKCKKCYGCTVFAIICQYGSSTLISKLLEQSDINFDVLDEDNRSCLMLSFFNTSKNVPRLLFAHPKVVVDVNHCDRYGQNVVMYASYFGNTDMVTQLLQYPGVAVNAANNAGATALMGASQNGHTEVVTQLLQCPGVAVNAADTEGVTALMYASLNGQTEVVTQLLQCPGVAVNAASNEGVTPLMWASQEGYTDVVTQLLQCASVSINAASRKGNTAVILASKNGHTDVVTHLLQCPGVDVDAADTEGFTALMAASQNGHTDVVTQLLQCASVSINAASRKGNTAVILASKNGHTEVVTQLLQCPSVAVNAANTAGVTALMCASQNGHTEVVTQLLQCNDIAINAASENGRTALMFASWNGHTNVITQLLQCPDLQLNAATHHNSTALTLASERGHGEVVKQLLQCQNLNVNAADNDGDNSIIMSCREGYTDIVAQLLECPQLDVNAKVIKSGATALIEACQKGHSEIVSHLLKCPRVEINATDHEGNTALMAACHDCLSDIVSQLLAVKNIDIQATNSNDKTALSYACESWSEDIMSKLIAALEM